MQIIIESRNKKFFDTLCYINRNLKNYQKYFAENFLNKNLPMK